MGSLSPFMTSDSSTSSSDGGSSVSNVPSPTQGMIGIKTHTQPHPVRGTIKEGLPGIGQLYTAPVSKISSVQNVNSSNIK
jgi:hypothetical protein